MSRLKNNKAVREQPNPKHRSINPDPDFSKSDSNGSAPVEIDVRNAGSLDQHAALLGDTRSGKLSDTLHRAMVVRQLQRNFGNRYVSRLLDHVSRQNSTGIQAKMAVGPAGDKYEREADQVAKQVLGQMKGAGEQPVQRQGIEEEELQMKPLQRQIGMEGGEVGPELEQSIERSRGKGQALPENLRRSMEGPFGEDFSGVRVHTDAQAHDLNDSVSARAFTTGQDIFFRKGEYNPGSDGGKQILAHELTHVVQQGAGVNLKRKGNSAPKDSEPSQQGETKAQQLHQDSLGYGGQEEVGEDTLRQEQSAIDIGPDQSPTTLHRAFEKDFVSPSIGTEQELSGAVMHKKIASGNSVGAVMKENENLLDVTTDMIQSKLDDDYGRYTIEIISHPTEMDNQSALLDRKDAFVNLMEKIKIAAGNSAALEKGPLASGAKLAIFNRDHTIHPSREGGSGTVMGSSNQSTVGVAIESIGTGENKGDLIEKAPWYKSTFKNELKDGDAYEDLEKVKNVYAYVMSILQKFAEITEKRKLDIGELSKETGYEGYNGTLFDPDVKNDWGLLPRSSPWAALDILPGGDKAKIRSKILGQQHGVDPKISKHCLNYIVRGQQLAGHANINDATVGGKQAALLEFRSESSMPDSLRKVFWKYGDEQSRNTIEEVSGAKWEKTETANFLRWSEESSGKWWFYNTETKSLCYYDAQTEEYSETKPYDRW